MIKLILLFVSCCTMVLCEAQTLSESVLATSGGNETISNLHLSWTFGEAVINTLSNENVILTCGFQQGERFCLGNLSSSKWTRMTKCTKMTATRDINDLIEKGILRKNQSGGRSTSYVLNFDLSGSNRF